MKKKEQRQREAVERNERWAALTPEEQMAHLDKLQLTAKKQRAKIQREIEKSNK